MEKQITQQEIDHFRNRLEEDEKSRATVEKYLRDIRRFQEFLDGRGVTKEVVIQYKQWLISEYAPSSVNSMLVALNRFFRELEWFECMVKTVKIQRQSFRDRNRELTKEEYFRLLETAKRQKDERLYYMLQTICATGIRVGELQFITVEAVNCGRARVNLKGKNRVVLLPSALCQELKVYAMRRAIRTGSIFITRNGNPVDRSNILHEMKALCETAQVDAQKVFPHNLRHLFACLYYKEVKDLGRLADILGHSSVNTTRIYTSVSGDEQIQQIEKLGLII